MESSIAQMINKYGSGMMLIHEGKKNVVKAFLQETASRSQGGAEWEAMPLGQVPKGVYVYIGPAEPEAVAGDILYCGKDIYQFRRTHLVFVKDRVQYCWGICVEKGGDSAWGE